MKRKLFLVGLVLILSMFLVGCGSGIVTPATDEEKVESVIHDYFLAINDQNWSKAKSYCVSGSDVYYETCLLEDEVNAVYQYASIVNIICFIDISDVSVSGNYASAYCSGTITIIVDGISHNSNYSSGYFYLQKVGNNWKIDSSD